MVHSWSWGWFQNTRKLNSNLNEEFLTRYSKYFDSTYTFFQDLQKIFESRLIVQIYLHICDILNPITTHPQLYPSCLVHQKSFNHLYEGHEMFRTLCRVFNSFSIESFSRSIVAVNWRWIWMYVRFCRTCELQQQGVVRGWICENEVVGWFWSLANRILFRCHSFVSQVYRYDFVYNLSLVGDWNFLLRFYAFVGCTTSSCIISSRTKRNILKDQKNSLVKNWFILKITFNYKNFERRIRVRGMFLLLFEV